jgi:hypothetical protein
MRRFLAFVLALGPLSSASTAQRPVTFGCSESYGQQGWDGGNTPNTKDRDKGGRAGFTRATGLRFEVVRNAGRIARIRKLRSKYVTGFSARYGVRRITFFARIRPSDLSSFFAEGLFYVELQSWAGARTYYAISSDDQPAFPISDSSFNVFRATPDRNIPLVVLQTSASFVGQHSSTYTATRELFDFRHAKPRSVASLDCSRDTEIFGTSCSWREEQELGRSSLECDWVPERTDFRCTQQTTSVLTWGSRIWKERFFLLSGTALWPLEIVENAPPSPYAWAESLKKHRSDPTGRTAVLPRVGDTFVLWCEEHQRKAMLLASRGNTGHLWPRLYLVVFHGDAPAQTDELEIRTLETNAAAQREYFGAADRWAQPTTPGILTGEPISLTLKSLEPTLPGVRFFQVLLTQNDHRALFWVGIDGRVEPQRGQALLIATDAAEFDACEYMRMPASAAIAEWNGGSPVLARLDVEPRRYIEIEGGDYLPGSIASGAYTPDIECPGSAELGWSAEKGWLIHHEIRDCDRGRTVVRAVAVSDQGEISASPARMSQEEH